MTGVARKARPRGPVAGFLARALLCLCIGALLNTALATACFLYSPFKMTIQRGGFSGDDVKGAIPRSVVFKPGDVYQGFGFEMRMNYWIWADPESAVNGAGISAFAAGWPFHAFTTPTPPFDAVGDYSHFVAVRDAAYALPSTTDLPGFLGARHYRHFPTRIRPIGFALNSALYGAIAAGLLYGWAALRSARRRRAGRCVPCGYELAGLPQCPECGSLSRVLTALGATLGLLVFGGCAVNCAPIHSDLSQEELSSRVSQRFHKGMSGEEVRTQLERTDLHYWDAQVPPRWLLGDPEEGIIATVRPHGLIRAGFAASLSWHQLLFYFSEKDKLERVAYGPGFSLLPTLPRRIHLNSEAAR